jgi:hypothetical protein
MEVREIKLTRMPLRAARLILQSPYYLECFFIKFMYSYKQQMNEHMHVHFLGLVRVSLMNLKIFI